MEDDVSIACLIVFCGTYLEGCASDFHGSNITSPCFIATECHIDIMVYIVIRSVCDEGRRWESGECEESTIHRNATSCKMDTVRSRSDCRRREIRERRDTCNRSFRRRTTDRPAYIKSSRDDISRSRRSRATCIVELVLESDDGLCTKESSGCGRHRLRRDSEGGDSTRIDRLRECRVIVSRSHDRDRPAGWSLHEGSIGGGCRRRMEDDVSVGDFIVFRSTCFESRYADLHGGNGSLPSSVAAVGDIDVSIDIIACSVCGEGRCWKIRECEESTVNGNAAVCKMNLIAARSDRRSGEIRECGDSCNSSFREGAADGPIAVECRSYDTRRGRRSRATCIVKLILESDDGLCPKNSALHTRNGLRRDGERGCCASDDIDGVDIVTCWIVIGASRAVPKLHSNSVGERRSRTARFHAKRIDRDFVALVATDAARYADVELSIGVIETKGKRHGIRAAESTVRETDVWITARQIKLKTRRHREDDGVIGRHIPSDGLREGNIATQDSIGIA